MNNRCIVKDKGGPLIKFCSTTVYKQLPEERRNKCMFELKTVIYIIIVAVNNVSRVCVATEREPFPKFF